MEATVKTALAQGLIKESFAFSDIRPKSISDDPNLQDASSRAKHSNTNITKHVYRRKHEEVKPLR